MTTLKIYQNIRGSSYYPYTFKKTILIILRKIFAYIRTQIST